MNKIYKLISALFIIFWIFFVYADYLQKHPRMILSLEVFKYYGLYLVYFILFAIITFLVYQKKILSKINIAINWLTVFIFTMLIGVLNVGAFVGQFTKVQTFKSLDFGNYLSYMQKYLFLAFATFLIISICYSIGNLFNRLIKARFQATASELMDIATGVFFVVYLTFILGAAQILNAFVLWPILIFFIAINYKSWLNFVKTVLFKPINFSNKLNVLGVFAMFCLLVMFSINFQQIIRPIPTGFDAIMLYVNLPSLIGDHGSLVAGFQPYNWSLFMALGFVLFDMTEVVLSLSAAGGVLSLFIMYYLGKNWFKININLLLLALAIFYLSPTIVHQSSKELKVDLGLLFFSFCSIILFVYWYYHNSKFLKIKEEKKIDFYKNTPYSFAFLQKLEESKFANFINKNINPYLILLGLFSGFALGIKLTAAFLILAVIAGMWYTAKGKKGFLAMFFICVFTVLFLKLDQTGDLRQYHLSANMLMYVSLVIGIALIVVEFLKDKKSIIHYTKSTIIYAIITILSFSPWVAKNIAETGSVSISAILVGKKLGPDIDASVIIKNFQDFNKR